MMKSVLLLVCTAALAVYGSGCAEGYNPLLADGGLMGTATGGATGAGGFAGTGGQTPGTGGVGGAGAGPVVSCTPGQLLPNACEICGVDGVPTMPDTDGRCMPHTCPAGDVFYLLEVEGDEATCYRVEPPVVPMRLCAAQGVCADQNQVCGAGERERVESIIQGECREMGGCTGASPPITMAVNEGVICQPESSSDVQIVRIQTPTGVIPVSWREIEVNGTVDGGPPMNLALNAEVTASHAQDSAGLATDGNPDTIWESGARAGVFIELDLRQRARIRSVVLVAAQGPDMPIDTRHEVVYRSSPMGPYNTQTILEGPTEDGSRIEYAPSGTCINGMCTLTNN